MIYRIDAIFNNLLALKGKGCINIHFVQARSVYQLNGIDSIAYLPNIFMIMVRSVHVKALVCTDHEERPVLFLTEKTNKQSNNKVV